MGKILKYWPKEEIIKALQQLSKDKPINKKSLFEYKNKKMICHPCVIATKFGSLKNACDVAGVRCDALYGKAHMQHMAKINTKWNKEMIITDLKNIYKKRGMIRPTDLTTYSDLGEICHSGSIYKHFGTYKNLFKEANVPYKNYYWDNDRIIETLTALNNEYGPLFNFLSKKSTFFRVWMNCFISISLYIC